MQDTPIVLEPAVRLRGLQMPARARGLVLVAHPDAASRQHCGQRFIADVLQANGLATLALTLHTSEEQQCGTRAPGMVQMRHRLRAVFDWLSLQEALGPRPVALLGVDDAVRGCIATAARDRPALLRSLVLLGGRADEVPHHLARLTLPALFVIGRDDARSLNRQRAALRQMLAPSRLEVLALNTRPVAAPGAHQAFAHAAMNWLTLTLWQDAGTSQALVLAGGEGPQIGPVAQAALPRQPTDLRAAGASR